VKPLTKQKGTQPEKMHEKLVSILVLNGVVGAMQYTAKTAIYWKCRILGIHFWMSDVCYCLIYFPSNCLYVQQSVALC
jgi:hypothetical protein